MQVPGEWFEQYGRRVEEYRLPRGKEARHRCAETVGADGLRLRDAVYAEAAPPLARTLRAVQLLRRVWIAEFQVSDGQVQQRAPDNMPPDDPEARFSIKRSTEWSGYKVHVRETCEDDTPHLLTHVATTVVTEPDVNHLEQIHNALAAKDLSPSEHLVDAGYPRAQSLVSSIWQPFFCHTQLVRPRVAPVTLGLLGHTVQVNVYTRRFELPSELIFPFPCCVH